MQTVLQGAPVVTTEASATDKPVRRRRSVNAEKCTGSFVLDDKIINLESFNQIQEKIPFANTLFRALRKSKRLVAVVGAGISVEAGIPDFRSQDGLFKTVKNTFNLKGNGKAMFDSSVYKDVETTRMFHSMINTLHLKSNEAKATSFHNFLSRLATDKRLLRLYTQNVDGLELDLIGLQTIIPLPSRAPFPKTIQLHGGLTKMVCAKCGWLGQFDPQLFMQSESPECDECKELDSVREVVGKRAQGVGRLRPRIVLYNEANPDAEAIGSVTTADLRARPDVLLVVGTSLQIPGVRRIVKEMAQAVRATGGTTIWINRDDPPAIKMLENVFDLQLRGDCQTLPLFLDKYEELMGRPKRQRKMSYNKNISMDSSMNLTDVYRVVKKPKQIKRNIDQDIHNIDSVGHTDLNKTLGIVKSESDERILYMDLTTPPK
ncbi:DHS-like NAD/FAD-binding domain-containing protein [Lipomyces oligophaga]|uniref:DHS-like NAD/FAD-binding domain-containing protein n=1 Tax=Lipomyces oligophaga TaxID=45792 RepID=UPI0034D0018D